jgi:two-component system, cell cycle response regulator
MFRIILRRYGIARVTIGLTLMAILLSLGMTWGVNTLLRGGPLGEGLAIAVIVPLVVAPLMNIQILRLIVQLDEAEQRLQVLSHTDDLTQTYNRRYFMQYIDHEFKRAKRYGTTFSVALLDIDNFKQINDQWGHLVGDQVLRTLTQMLKASLRQTDVCARYGGDEFVFLFPQTDKLQTEIWVRRVYEIFAARSIQVDELQITPLFSVGVAAYEASFDNFDQLLKQADEALYRAKHTGGNHFVLN